MIHEKQLQLNINYIKEGKRGLMLLIKPGEEAIYSDVIDMLNEALINNVKKYVVLEPDVEEIKWMGKKIKRRLKNYTANYMKRE